MRQLISRSTFKKLISLAVKDAFVMRLDCAGYMWLYVRADIITGQRVYLFAIYPRLLSALVRSAFLIYP